MTFKMRIFSIEASLTQRGNVCLSAVCFLAPLLQQFEIKYMFLTVVSIWLLVGLRRVECF